MLAVARLDWGRWLADCPAPGCTNAMGLERGQDEFLCRFLIDAQRQAYGGCGAAAGIVWPGDVDAIECELVGEAESAQNWRPSDD
jgi:hypothetical protein